MYQHNLTELQQSNILAPISQDRIIQKRHCIVTMSQAKDPETLEDFHAEVSRYDEDESMPELQAEDDYDYDDDNHNHDDDNDDDLIGTLNPRYQESTEYHQQDYRDAKVRVNAFTVMCMFCGVNPAIIREEAIRNGLDWDEYVNSIRVDGYRRHNSCWNCKNTHKSMCTENMARKKFAKKLDDAVFVSLRMDGRTFHHQPVTNMTNESTRNSEYFWYPDLEREALARGWNPRGEMKNNVPWRRKDLPQVVYSVEPL